jgi:hypothetical protein
MRQLLGFLFIEAKDLNEALRVAAWMPQAQRGLIEMRPRWLRLDTSPN